MERISLESHCGGLTVATRLIRTLRESVIRHRGAVRGENDELIAGVDAPMTAMAVAPGGSSGVPGGSEYIARGRTGEDITYTVYFEAGADIVNSDELTVRGERFRIIVDDWRCEDPDLGGVEVRCTRGQG